MVGLEVVIGLVGGCASEGCCWPHKQTRGGAPLTLNYALNGDASFPHWFSISQIFHRLDRTLPDTAVTLTPGVARVASNVGLAFENLVPVASLNLPHSRRCCLENWTQRISPGRYSD